MIKTTTLCSILTALLLLTFVAHAQPLTKPYAFSFGDGVEINESLSQMATEPAGSKGRVVLTQDGHLGFADGTRLRLAGTVLHWLSAFPDSSGAVRLAKRLHSLGINCVRLNTFDVSVWSLASVFTDGQTTLGGGLSPEQMKRFDWLMYQLKQHGIYFSFTFHGVWTPRSGDGVIQPDSSSWGTRVPLMFNPVVQQLHRNIMRTLLTHVNPYTGNAYKDEPALAFVTVAEDASPIVYWLYTQDIVRPNTFGSVYSGSQHVALIDSTWKTWLQNKYSSDNALIEAWSTKASDPANVLQNGGFEDPFSAVWQFFVNSTAGAQALLQFSDADKVEGASSARIRINKLDPTKTSYSMNLNQKIPVMRRQQTYELSFWAKTSAQRGAREMAIYVYNGTSPYNSYGLQRAVSMTSTWQKFTYSFTSTATDSTTAYVGFLLGSDSGDVFLDDVQFKQIAVPGLRAGESLSKRNIKLSPLLDETITAERSKDNALFVYENYRSMLLNARKLVRDTLKSQVLMSPSARLIAHFELDAAREYEVFCNTEWRQSEASMLTETSGGTLAAHAQLRPLGKAFVLGFLGYQYPRPYQSEMLTVMPSYAGLQDWDGVFYSVYSENGTSGADKIDSNSYWTLHNKPHLQALLPWSTSLVRTGAIATSGKEIILQHTSETAELPRWHVQNTFNLSVPTDSRIPLFRKLSVDLERKSAESLLPHLEVSALSGDVDLAALDAENEQIYRDQTKAIMRVVTPTHEAVAGPLGGQIITAGHMSVEQTSGGPNAVVALHSLTSEPLQRSSSALLTISTRSMNEGAQLNPEGSDFTLWGSRPIQMESAVLRVSLSSKQFDSLTIVPLGRDGQPMADVMPIGVSRNGAGKFVVQLNTQMYATPWYRLVYGTTTSVREYETETIATVYNENDDQIITSLTAKCEQVQLVSSCGDVVFQKLDADGQLVIPMDELSQGMYQLIVRSKTGQIIAKTIVIIRSSSY